MRLLPVVDVLQGQAVHACAGRRENYQPLTSCWSSKAHDPERLLHALHAQFGCLCFYVADLDALTGRPAQHDLIVALVRSGFSLWLDSAIQSADQVRHWLECGIQRVIIASETLPSLDALTQIAEQIDPQQIIVSLDFFQDTFKAPFELDADEMTAHGLSLGLSSYIYLDTARVGTHEGAGELSFCLELKRRYPSLFLITGGGVRDCTDLDRLAQAGVDVALIATALHQGRLNSVDIERYPFI